MTTLILFSFLELAPVKEGSEARRAAANMIELAGVGKRLGTFELAAAIKRASAWR